MHKFEEQSLRRELDRLPPSSRVAFAASCAQRLVGICHRFLAEAGRYDRASDCDRALEYVWTHILEPTPGGAATQLLADVMALVPDQDAPRWTPLTAYGDDALSALAYCLSCLQSGDSQDAAWAARRVYEAVDCFVTGRDMVEPNDSEADTRVLGDTRIQAELERQAHDISELSRMGSSLSEKFLNDLRQRSTRHQAIVVD